MSTYLECYKQAQVIGQKFHELLGNQGQQKNFFLEYPDLTNLDISSPILILGLNPSGEDQPSELDTKPNLFSYIPQNPDIKSTEVYYKELQQFCYSPYFKTFIECFQRLKPPYNPLWYNKDVLEQIYSANKEHLSKEQLNYLLGYSGLDERNYIIFADLVQYSKTNSKAITEHLSNDTVVDLLKGYIGLLFEYIKPKLVLSANAAVSHFLIDNFNQEIVDTNINIHGTNVFLGSMLTGQRAMDIYSRKRLFNEIQDFINSNP